MSGNVQVVWTGVSEMSAYLVRIVAAQELASQRAVQRTALAVVREAKLRSTGPPRLVRGDRPGEGPGVRSGRHRNSIKIVSQGPLPHGWFADVSATMAYSRRLELGFTGTDSRGRTYNQPPYPYLRPAMDMVNGTIAESIFAAEWAAAIEKT